MKFVLWCILLIAILITIGRCVEAGETADDIAYLLTANDPELYVKAWPNHPLRADVEGRERLAAIIDRAAADYPAISPTVLVAVAYRESSFRPHVVGPVGERSLFQFNRSTARHVRLKIDKRCNLQTVEGSAYCAAAWLAWSRDHCGSLRDAFVIYLQGRKCTARSDRILKKAELRVDLINHLKDRRSRSLRLASIDRDNSIGLVK